MEQVPENYLEVIRNLAKLQRTVAGLGNLLNILLGLLLVFERRTWFLFLAIPLLEYRVETIFLDWPEYLPYKYVYVLQTCKTISAVFCLWVINKKAYLPLICCCAIVFLNLWSLIIKYQHDHLIRETRAFARRHRWRG